MRLRNACAHYLNKHFGIDKQHLGLQVKFEHMIMGTGLITILNVVSRAICNPGDSILMRHTSVGSITFSRIHSVSAPSLSTLICRADEVTYLEAAIKMKDLNINAVVLCKPHNPLCLSYHKDKIEAYCKFADTYNLHLISDEVYGQSGTPFSEAARCPLRPSYL